VTHHAARRQGSDCTGAGEALGMDSLTGSLEPARSGRGADQERRSPAMFRAPPVRPRRLPAGRGGRAHVVVTAGSSNYDHHSDRARTSASGQVIGQTVDTSRARGPTPGPRYAPGSRDQGPREPLPLNLHTDTEAPARSHGDRCHEDGVMMSRWPARRRARRRGAAGAPSLRAQYSGSTASRPVRSTSGAGRRPGQALIPYHRGPVNPSTCSAPRDLRTSASPLRTCREEGVGTVAEADGIPAGQRVGSAAPRAWHPATARWPNCAWAPENALRRCRTGSG